MSDPFSPGPPVDEPVTAEGRGYREGPRLQPCAGCGAPIDPTQANYSESGDMMCRTCLAHDTINTGNRRAGSAIVGTAVGALSLGLLSLCFNPCLIISVMAITTGIGCIVTMVRHPEYRQAMGVQWGLAYALSVIGILLGFAYPLLGIFAGLLAAAH